MPSNPEVLFAYAAVYTAVNDQSYTNFTPPQASAFQMRYQSNPNVAPQQPYFPWKTTPRYLHKPMLPSPPELMIGRHKEKTDVVDTLLRKSPARVAILGESGMGKTTLALSILHEPVIVEQYPSRYFIACEGVLSISSLVEEIANALRIPPANRDPFLMDTILSSFPNKTLLCLDNFETLWDDEAKRSDIEEFLSVLQQRVKSLIITMHGAQRPSRVSWSKPFLSPLQPLTGDISGRILEEMTGHSADKFVEKLVTAADGIPLAVSLISALLCEGHESSRSLWNRWKRTQSRVLESGGKHRLSNLDTFIHLSVYGPQMQADPTTVDILAMLSVLPDGFPNHKRAVKELQSHLPEGYDLRKALLTMRRVSLVHVNEAAVPHRLRMLSPIQSFCERTLEGSEELRNGITSYYVQLIRRFKDVTNSDGHAIIPSEMHNVRAVLLQAWRRGKSDVGITVASIQFTLWSTYLGNHVEEVVRAAIQGKVGGPDLQGDCHRAVGEVHLRRSELDEAGASFKHAAKLHRQAHNVAGEGSDLQKVGEVHLRQFRLDKAEASFKRAAELHRKADDIFGEGYNLQKLGEVHLRRDKLENAKVAFKHAAELHQQVYDIVGEGNDLGNLGEVYLRQHKLDKAEASLNHAIELHQRARDIDGEGNDLRHLGEVLLRQDKLNEAEALFKRAVDLHQQAHNILGEGDDIHKLGRVQLRREKLDEGEVLFRRAAELHGRAHDVLGEGDDLQKLGRVHLRRNQLDEAEAFFKRAAELHQRAHDVLGVEHDLWMLKRVRLRRSKLRRKNTLDP